MIFLILIAIIILCIIIGINENKQKKRYENGLMTDEEKIKYEKKIEQREINMQNYQKIQENNKRKKTIKQVMIVGNETDSRKKAGSTITRGVVGGAVGGLINPLVGVAGLAGGAMSGKNKIKGKTTFLIEYEDGHRETKIVDNNSAEFKKLCNYIKMQ